MAIDLKNPRSNGGGDSQIRLNRTCRGAAEPQGNHAP